MLSRTQTCLDPERYSGGKGDAWKKVGGQFVVAGVDAAEVLEAAEDVLDEVTAVPGLILLGGTTVCCISDCAIDARKQVRKRR
jgi:hypothetical protein